MHQSQQQTQHACLAVSGQKQRIMHAIATQMHAAMDGPSAIGPQWPASQSMVCLFMHNVEQTGHNSYSNQEKSIIYRYQ